MCKNNPSCNCHLALRPRKLSQGGGFQNTKLIEQGQNLLNPRKPNAGMDMGQMLGIAGGVGTAAAGLASASSMPTVDATKDPVGALRAENDKMKAQEKAVNDGAATAAGAVNPLLGVAFKVGGGISSGLRDSNEDEYGVQRTDGMGVAKQSLAEIADPLSANMRAFKRFGDSDYSTKEKILGAIPMMGGLFTRDGNERKRERIKSQMMRATVNQSEAGIYARAGARLRPRKLAVGGMMAGPPDPPKPTPPLKPKPAVPAAAPTAAYSLANPSPQAELYYKNVLPTMAKMTGGKYNETYIDPASGKSCQGNSCLAFANSALEVATGQKTIDDAYNTPVVRDRAHAYNPEFTKRSQELGWERIPLGQAKAGDRIQYWNAAGNAANGVDRAADTGTNNYLPGKYPSHMMVFGGWNGALDPKTNNRSGVVYNDGHEFENADRVVRPDINPNDYVAYRYIGVSGQPTNDPKQAVAVNPAATQRVATRANGGTLIPRKLASGGSLIVDGALHSQKHGLEGENLGKTGVPVMHVESGERAAEIERNEIILGDTVTERLEKLQARHNNGDKLAARMAGMLLAKEIKENTQPNARYEKRLKPRQQVHLAEGGTLAVLGADGAPVAHFNGTNRVMSQTHTRELVTKSLSAKHNGHHRNLGLRAFTMLKQQDARPTEYAKS